MYVLPEPTYGARGISAFVVEKTDPGVSFGEPENKLGIKDSPTRAVVMEDAHIPANRIIGATSRQLAQGGVASPTLSRSPTFPPDVRMNS